MQAKDKFDLLKILHLSVKMIFDHKRYRKQLVLLIKLANIISNWPSTFLCVCYNNVKIILLPDPQDGKFPQRLIKIAFKNTKKYLEENETFAFLSVVLISYRII